MDPILQNKNILSQLISETQSIGIVTSEKQTLDSLAAALSLHLIFQDSGKNSQVVSRTDPTVEHSSLVGIDNLKKNFGGITKLLTVSFPYNDGEIEKVSYNIEGNKLNVNLFAEEQGIKFSEKDIKYIRQGSTPQVIFAIGIENPSLLEGFAEASTKVVNIDNSANNSLYGDVVIVDPSYSSLSEMVARMAFDLSLQVEFDVAQNLLDGITFSTNNFNSPKTSGTAFEMAGVLMQKGAVRREAKGGDRPQFNDSSLNVLGKKQFGQQKPFNQGNQGKQFGNQNKQFKQSFNQKFQNQNQKTFDKTLDRQENETSIQDRDRSQTFSDEQVVQQRNEPTQPRTIEEVTDASQPQFDSSSNNNIPEIPAEDQAPSDWFTPKVFKSNKN